MNVPAQPQSAAVRARAAQLVAADFGLVCVLQEPDRKAQRRPLSSVVNIQFVSVPCLSTPENGSTTPVLDRRLVTMRDKSIRSSSILRSRNVCFALSSSDGGTMRSARLKLKMDNAVRRRQRLGANRADALHQTLVGQGGTATRQ